MAFDKLLFISRVLDERVVDDLQKFWASLVVILPLCCNRSVTQGSNPRCVAEARLRGEAL